MCTYLNFTSRFVCWLVCSHLSRLTVFNSLFETGLALGFVCLFVCLFTISQILQVYSFIGLQRLQVYQSTVCTCWTIKNPLKLASLVCSQAHTFPDFNSLSKSLKLVSHVFDSLSETCLTFGFYSLSLSFLGWSSYLNLVFWTELHLNLKKCSP